MYSLLLDLFIYNVSATNDLVCVYFLPSLLHVSPLVLWWVGQMDQHVEVANRVMAQINSLCLPLGASTLLLESLQAKVGRSGSGAGGRGAGGSAGGDGVKGEWDANSSGLSLEERQLLLEERLQASREAESAQALAERRLKLMEVCVCGCIMCMFTRYICCLPLLLLLLLLLGVGYWWGGGVEGTRICRLLVVLPLLLLLLSLLKVRGCSMGVG